MRTRLNILTRTTLESAYVLQDVQEIRGRNVLSKQSTPKTKPAAGKYARATAAANHTSMAESIKRFEKIYTASEDGKKKNQTIFVTYGRNFTATRVN